MHIVFRRSVIQEVKHQVLRLQYHPSVILWAGNNENEGALRDNWYGTAYNFTLYKSDYVKLYVNTIKETLFKYDDSREFIVSSPTNGIESDEEGYVAKNPGSSFYGDGMVQILLTRDLNNKNKNYFFQFIIIIIYKMDGIRKYFQLLDFLLNTVINHYLALER